jgi:hypothetical protein
MDKSTASREVHVEEAQSLQGVAVPVTPYLLLTTCTLADQHHGAYINGKLRVYMQVRPTWTMYTII